MHSEYLFGSPSILIYFSLGAPVLALISGVSTDEVFWVLPIGFCSDLFKLQLLVVTQPHPSFGGAWFPSCLSAPILSFTSCYLPIKLPSFTYEWNLLRVELSYPFKKMPLMS